MEVGVGEWTGTEDWVGVAVGTVEPGTKIVFLIVPSSGREMGGR